MKVRTLNKILRVMGPNSSRRRNYGLRSWIFGFEETWLGSPGRPDKKSKPLFSISLWNQFENTRNGNQRTNNNVEVWHCKDTRRRNFASQFQSGTSPPASSATF